MSIASGKFNELTRVLERVCRAVNPPHKPRIDPVMPTELGVVRLGLQSADPRLAYRYLRGLQLEPEQTHAGVTVPSAAAVWLPAGGPLTPGYSFCEIQPGEFAVGEESGHIRVFQRAPRGRWECAAVIAAHNDAVMDIAALPGGGFVSAGRDRTVRVFDTDKRGLWRETFRSDAHSDTVNAVCVLGGSAFASGGRDALVQFYVPDGIGAWSPSVQYRAIAQVVALEALDEQTVTAAIAGQAAKVLRLGNGARTVDVQSFGAADVGSPSDLARSPQRLFACFASGRITVHSGIATGRPLQTSDVTVGSAQLLGVCAIDDEHFATWGNDNAVRVWSLGSAGRPEQRAQFVSPATGLSRVASLCDGRIVFNETGRIVVAGPDRDGNWRVEDELTRYAQPITTIAPLGADQIACVWPHLGLFLLDRTKTGNDADWDAILIDSSVSISALASIGDDTFASVSESGAVTAYRRDDKDKWAPEEVASSGSGALGALAFGGDQWLAVGRPGGLVIWRRASSGKFAQVADLAFEVKDSPSLVVGNSAGLFAVGFATSSLLIAGPRSDGTWRVQATINALTSIPISACWHDDNLLLVGQAGGWVQIFAVSDSKAELIGEIENEPGAGAIAISSRNGVDFAVVKSSPSINSFSIAAQSRKGGVREVAIAPRPPSELHRLYGPLQVAAFGENSVFIGADALYVIDDVATGSMRMARVQVSSDAVLAQMLDASGRVRQARIRRRASGDISSPWTIDTVADGLRLPNDSLLHPHAAFVDHGGRLQEASLQSAQVEWESGDHTLLLQDPALP